MQFLDRLIPYDIFLNDLAARIVKFLKSDNNDPEFISQRRAYEMFGRRNVERWRRMGKVVAYKDRARSSTGRPTCACCSVSFRTISTKTLRKMIWNDGKRRVFKQYYGYVDS